MYNVKLLKVTSIFVIVIVCVIYIISRYCRWRQFRENFDNNNKQIFVPSKFFSLYGKTLTGQTIDVLVKNVYKLQIIDSLYGTQSVKKFILILDNDEVKTFGPLLVDNLEYSTIDNTQLC